MPTIKQKTINLLRWSEKYTKTDMVYFANNGFWVLLGQVTVSVAAFATTLVLANMLSKELFGQYRFIVTIIPILGLFTLSSLGDALIRSVARGHKINWSYVLRVKVFFGLLAMSLSLFIAAYYLIQGNILLSKIYGVIAIFIIFYDLFLLYNHYLQGIRDFKHASRYLGLTRIMQMILVILVAITTHNILLIVASFFIGLIVPQYFFYRHTRKLHIIKSKKDPEVGVIRYSIHLTAVHGLILITSNLDKLFTWHYLDVEQFAIYAIGLTLPLNIPLLFNFISQIYFPSISILTLDLQTRILIIKRILLMLVILSLIALLYIFIAPQLLALLFSTYSIPLSIIITLAALIPLLPINTLIMQIFQAHNMLRYIITLRILLTVTFVITFYTLPYTIFASATAFVVGECVMMITSIGILRYLPMKELRASIHT